MGDVERGLGALRTIYLSYAGKTFLGYFLAVLLVFSFLMFSVTIIPVIELLLLYKASFFDAFMAMIFMIPNILNFVFPAACLSGGLLCYYQFSDTNELIALSSAGFNTWEIVRPIFLLGMVMAILNLVLTSYLAPMANLALSDTLFNIARSSPNASIKPQVFVKPFPHITVFANETTPETGQLKKVLFMDQRDPEANLMVVADLAHIQGLKDQQGLVIEFEKGFAIIFKKEPGPPKYLSFEKYKIQVLQRDILERQESRKNKPKELTISELLKELEKEKKDELRINDLRFALYSRLFLPTTGLLLVLIGSLLPIKIHFSQRSIAFFSGLMVFGIYYLCFAGMKSLAKTGIINPLLANIFPLFLVSVILFILLKAKGYGREIRIPNILKFNKAFVHE